LVPILAIWLRAVRARANVRRKVARTK